MNLEEMCDIFEVIKPLYSVWSGMIRRCHVELDNNYKRYGARGIKVCDEWRNSFRQFVIDVGLRPFGTSLDRVDNDGNYEPNNVRWASQKVQMKNRRVVRRLLIEGKQYLACELAEQSGLKTDTVLERAFRGLSLNEILAPERRIFVDGLAFGGRANGERQRAKTHCPGGHEYNEKNTHFNSIGHRTCRICKKERMKKFRIENPERFKEIQKRAYEKNRFTSEYRESRKKYQRQYRARGRAGQQTLGSQS